MGASPLYDNPIKTYHCIARKTISEWYLSVFVTDLRGGDVYRNWKRIFLKFLILCLFLALFDYTDLKIA